MLTENARLSEQGAIEVALSNTTPSSTSPRRFSMKGYSRCTIIITALNATTVTGSAITLKQATDIANVNSDEKALSFTKVWRNVDRGASNTLAEAAVASDTFTTDSTNSKELEYQIEVKAEDLDVDNGFDCLRVGTGNAVATTLSIVMIFWGARYGKVATARLDPSAN
ncbi:hypothetical protein A1351_23340 [Methylosinus sp. R-45379]|uniref:hypothetical protein n=1 Tax=Methylosinus sp. R-45379 TaxID=980563 RepID=UPI0007C97D5D|nr:hypothetical protein [Methylosinus sp. R-45379]OAI29449.1 hypothetical protein A1351_23340 [Methylosinus sp. R-45379]